MNLGEMREGLSFLIGFTSDAVGQDFKGTTAQPWKRIDWLLNQARRNEYSYALSECGASAFAETKTFVWASDDATRALPDGVTADQIVGLYNVTGGEPGDVIVIGPRESTGDVTWADRKTLRWGSAGPGQDTTIMIHYTARPDDLAEETEECDLIPAHFHDVYVWSAGVLARTVADEQAPGAWMAHREELREQIVAHLSRSRPRVGGSDSTQFQDLGE